MRSLSNGAVSVNNESISIVPGSLTYSAGHPQVTSRATASGGLKTKRVSSLNIEEAYGKVTFEMFPTGDLDGKIAEWKSNIDANLIIFTEDLGLTIETRVFKNASLVNDPEVSVSPDGTVSLEWHADQME